MFGTHNLWGIDLGGTKVEGAILESANNPQVLFRDRLPTGADQGYDHIIGQIVSIVDLMKKSAGYTPAHIGFATPGIRDPQQGTMKNCNSTALNGRPLKEDLERLLGTRVTLANDANCFALAETRMGIVKRDFPNARVVFGVIMGTGVGGGLVVNGQVVNGHHGIGGEWGHNLLDAETGLACYCGKIGCVEQVLSGPALQDFYFKSSGRAATMKEIYGFHIQGQDPYASETIQRMILKFGQAISVIINIVDPDVIVIGGGLGNIDLIYTEGKKAIRPHIFNYDVTTPIVKPMLGDSAGVFGAAYL